MKPSMIVGILLAVVGAVIVFRGVSMREREDIVRIGDVRISAEQRRSIPPWVGAAAIVGGMALVIAGTKRSQAT